MESWGVGLNIVYIIGILIVQICMVYRPTDVKYCTSCQTYVKTRKSLFDYYLNRKEKCPHCKRRT